MRLGFLKFYYVILNSSFSKIYYVIDLFFLMDLVEFSVVFFSIFSFAWNYIWHDSQTILPTTFLVEEDFSTLLEGSSTSFWIGSLFQIGSGLGHIKSRLYGLSSLLDRLCLLDLGLALVSWACIFSRASWFLGHGLFCPQPYVYWACPL